MRAADHERFASARLCVGVGAVVGLLLGAFACVGDTSNPAGLDAGADAAPPDVVSHGDSASTDAADAAVTCDPTKPFGPIALVGELDMAGDNAGVRLSFDYLTAYFASTRDGGLGMSDLYSATRSDLTGPFANITAVANVNTTSDEKDGTLSKDDQTLIFSSLRSGSYDLYAATRTNALAPFTNVSVIANVNQGAFQEQNPFLREDGAELYFASDRAGSYDIFRSLKSGAGFGAPSSVDELNTASSEGNAVVTPDGLTIYWASSRPDLGSKGGVDIFMASRTAPTSPFSSPANVGELNSSSNDYPSFVTRDGCTLYCSSNRAGVYQAYVATRGK